MLDTVQSILQWVDDYGADKVFMVFFFVLYILARRKLDKEKDERLEDNKKALGALIEAKHVFAEMNKNAEELNDKFEAHEKLDIEEFGKIKGRLDIVIEKLEARNDS